MKRIFPTTLFIGAFLVGLVLLGATMLPWSVADSNVQEQVSTDISKIQSDPGNLQGLFSGEVKLDWTVLGAYTDPLLTPTTQPTEMPPPPDLGAMDLALQLTQSGNTVSGFVDLENTLVYTKEATIMATPVMPTPLPGTPVPGATPLAIGPKVSGTFDGVNLRLESEKVSTELAGQPIQRQFQLIGTATWEDNNVTLTGEFRETVWGYVSEPLTVIGYFDLSQALYNEDTIVISTATPILTSTPTSAATNTPTSTPTGTLPSTSTPTPTSTTVPGDDHVWLVPGNSNASAGAEFDVDLMAEQAAIGGFEFVLSYDPAIVHVLSVETGDWLDGTGLTPQVLTNDIDNTSGEVNFVVFSLGTGEPPTGQSHLARFRMQAQGAGTTPLSLEILLSNAAGIEIPATVQSGSVTVQQLFGDINGDCKVNILDIQQVASGWNTALGDPDYNPAFDVNNDDKVNILDIQQVASRWGDVCGEVAAASAASAPEQTAHVALDPASGHWPMDFGEYAVSVNVSDVLALGGYESTLSFDPSLLEVVEVTQADWLASSGRSILVLGPNIDNVAGKVQFGAASFGAKPGVEGNGTLAIVYFQPLAAGVSSLAFSGTTLSSDQGRAIPISVTSGSVEITPGGELTTKLYLPMTIR